MAPPSATGPLAGPEIGPATGPVPNSPAVLDPRHAAARGGTAAAPPAARLPSGIPLPVALLLPVVAGLLIRVALLPVPGLLPDLEGFARWAHGIATGGFTTIYDDGLVYPALVPWIWGGLSLVQPALRASADMSDPTVFGALKVPGVVADIGLALAVGYGLRARPRWAFAAAAALLLHPALIHISAWWGQFDSIYGLAAVVAWLLISAGRLGWAAVALAAMVTTKPQAVVLLVPYGAWYLGRLGPRGLVRPVAAGLLTIVVLWLPFLAAGGPQAWLANLAANQDGPFGVLSLRAWNPWWIIQVVASNGEFAIDSDTVGGLLTFRQIGLILAVLFELPIFLAVLRSPTPRTLAWGVAAAQLAALMTLTTMHERYAFVAVAMLPLAFPDRRAVGLWLALSVVFTLNVLAAVPPTPAIHAALPVGGVLGVVGSYAMALITIATVLVLARGGGGMGEGARPAATGAARAARPA